MIHALVSRSQCAVWVEIVSCSQEEINSWEYNPLLDEVLSVEVTLCLR